MNRMLHRNLIESLHCRSLRAKSKNKTKQEKKKGQERKKENET